MTDPQSAALVQQLSTDIQSKFDSGSTHIRNLFTLFGQYKSVVDDLVQLKTKYVEIIGRYAGAQSSRAVPSSLPGISASSPTYSLDSMRGDSAEVQKMGATIGELENQRDLIYSQMRQLLEQTVKTTSSLVDSALQVDLFLSQQISAKSSGGVYGHAQVNQRAGEIRSL